MSSSPFPAAPPGLDRQPKRSRSEGASPSTRAPATPSGPTKPSAAPTSFGPAPREAGVYRRRTAALALKPLRPTPRLESSSAR
eukprot:10175224-Alexandrium_andersonii.AAC.1